MGTVRALPVKIIIAAIHKHPKTSPHKAELVMLNFLMMSLDISPDNLPSDATHIHNAAIALAYCDLEPVAATPCSVNEKPTTTVHSANIAEATVAEVSFAVATGNRPATTDIRSDIDINGHGFGG